jgi:MFS family permease
LTAAANGPAAADPPGSIETRRSWIVAVAAVVMLSVAQGGPLTVVVGLPTIAEEFGGRSVPSLATALAFVGTGVGGVLSGLLTGRFGMKRVAMLAGLLFAAGLALAAQGASWQLLAGIALGVGVCGTGALFAPMLAHVSMWFDRNRGSAIALVSSGQYVAGALWPPIFHHSIQWFGWQKTMLGFGLFGALVIVPLAALVITRPPMPQPGGSLAEPQRGDRVLGMTPNLALGLIALAGFMCCIPMAMPLAHLVAHCVDLGISASVGAVMLSVLLFAAFVSRQAWGAISDRIGGLATVLTGNILQVLGMVAFYLTTDERGLFVVAGIYGLGFAGIIPAYVLTVRNLYPAAEAHWRVPVFLMVSLSGMAFGAWFAGFLYDRAGSYALAWAIGIVVNLLQIALVALLLGRQRAGTA